MNTEQKKLLMQLSQMGDVVLIKDGNRIHLDENAKIPLKTQTDALLYFLQRLDIDMVDKILDEHRTYQNLKKSLFIKKLSNAFDEFTLSENTYLNRYDGFCNSELCNFKCKGFSFIGNKSGHYFNLIIDSKDGVIYDIYECSHFKTENQNIKRKNRVFLDDIPF